MNILVVTDQDLDIHALSERIGIDVGHNNTNTSNIAVYDCDASQELPKGWESTVMVYGSCKYAVGMNVSEIVSPSVGTEGLADIINEYLVSGEGNDE
jgi:hypothetical protein